MTVTERLTTGVRSSALGRSLSPRSIWDEWRQLGPVEKLTTGVLVTLPFTQALTLDVGFPLKIYEVMLAASLALLLWKGTWRSLQWRLNRLSVICLLAFAAISLLSLITNAIAGSAPPVGDIYRFGPFIDGLTQVVYLLLAYTALVLVIHLGVVRPAVTIRAWLLGTTLASLYSLYHGFGAMIGTTFPLLPGASGQEGYFADVSIIRSGTFLEGNFLALYLATSLAVALLAGRFLVAILASVAILTTLSTITVLAVPVMWMMMGLTELVSRRRAASAAVATATLAAIMVAMPLSYYEAVVFSKFGIEIGGADSQSDQKQGTTTGAGGGRETPTHAEKEEERLFEARSSSERRATAVAAFEIFRDNPVLGVGPAQFGVWFQRYRPDFLFPGFLPPGNRYIPNNVYLQILSEQGILGLLALAVFAGGIFITAVRRHPLGTWPILITSFLLIFVALNAYPTFLLIFLWAWLGIAIGVENWRADEGAPAPPDRVGPSPTVSA